MPTPFFAIARPDSGWTAAPLETLVVLAPAGSTVVARDGAGREYARLPSSGRVEITVGGALGRHAVEAVDASGTSLGMLQVEVEARTTIADAGGRYADLLRLLDRTLRCYGPEGTGTIAWHGKPYRYFVPWILDHVHTAKGMRYSSDATGGLVELMAGAQRDDGMIWSFAFPVQDGVPGYHYWAYKDQGYAKADGGVLFGRQPVENHCEYNFVDGLHQAWKASGDDAWMARHLDAARRALDYGMRDRARWSQRFELLKRGCTIDSWDFQAEDGPLPDVPLGRLQQIDPAVTKFVVFFGDNHGYAHACDQLAEMLDRAGRAADATAYRERARGIRERLDRIAWNGRFFTHHVEEDDSVHRDFGVDEKAQIAMSNAYALNRGIAHERAAAILRTYRELSAQLPERSPGEWYAIYPPYERGFGKDSEKWQYMNAGVHGHAAGELARGAFAHGFETYGVDILARLHDLGKKHGDKIHFAYTGGFEPAPPAPVYTPVPIAAQAVMGLVDHAVDGAPSWMGEGGGNDLRSLPVGRQDFAGIPWQIADPSANRGRAAIAVAEARAGFPRRVEVPIGRAAAAVQLLHTANGGGPSTVVGSLTFAYADGSSRTINIERGKHLSGWWFPALKGLDAGIAWRGANGKCGDVGLSWCRIANPEPTKQIAALGFAGSAEGSLYAVLGLTLADRLPYREPSPVSHGGPDNWSGGTCMAALIEGLCGVEDEGAAFATVRLSPRWSAAGVDEAAVTVRYGASRGYVAYRYRHDRAASVIEVLATGSGERCRLRVLLPEGVTRVAAADVDGRAAAVVVERIESSLYAALPIALGRATRVRLRY